MIQFIALIALVLTVYRILEPLQKLSTNARQIVREISALNYQIATSTEQMSGVANELNSNSVTISGLATESMETAVSAMNSMQKMDIQLQEQGKLVE